MSKLAARIEQYPQVLVNVIVDNEKKADALADDELSALTKEIENKLGKNGRVLIRASGTEPLVRIMIEGQDEKSILDQALSLAHIIVRKYNGKIRT
ncbi:Phosphoglucosamine mutase [bioreactor metagenome]|uniref:Phosphoglucosamine mutase n=1 Tax=bioreactor metagenome TaxID=1076179 RepID=A0A645EYJ0_9ZZZZ